MANESDKLQRFILGNAEKYIRNDGDPIADNVEVELSDNTDYEIELAFTLKRDRYYLRMRRDDVRRLLDSEQ